MKLKITFVTLFALAVFAFTGLTHNDAFAQDRTPSGSLGLMPSISGDQIVDADTDIDSTHPPLRITPDRPEMVKLNKNAATVIVGNPENVSVMLENPQLMVVVPKLPGATHITVLDDRSRVIMQRHVIIASPKEKYIRLRKNCNIPAPAGDSSYSLEDCKPLRVYYCPNNDMCHEVSVTDGEDDDTGRDDSSDEAGDEAADSMNDAATASYEE